MRQKLASIMTEYIKQDLVLYKRMSNIIQDQKLFNWILNELFKPMHENSNYESIVVLDWLTPEIVNIVEGLRPVPKIIELEVFFRHGAKNVKMLRFTPYPHRTITKRQVVEGEESSEGSK